MDTVITAMPLWPELEPGQEFDYGTTSTQIEFKAVTRSFGPCPKCDEREMDVRYHKGGRDVYYPYEPESCRYTEACGDLRSQKPHLLVTCTRCRYGWKETPSSKRARP